MTNASTYNNNIHPTAVIAEDVILGSNVIIHPYVVIQSGVEIGDNVEIFPFAYIGKEPKGAGAVSRKIEFIKKIIIGANCSIGPHVTLYYDVQIGEHTLIGDCASIREQTTIGSYCLISRHVSINYNTKIGNRVKMMDLSLLAGNCSVGDDAFISGMVATANNNHIGQSREHVEETTIGPTIEKHATIGLGAVLLPNITIGEYAMVGAGAVVTKDVPAHSVAKGIPARAVLAQKTLEAHNA